MSEEAGSRGSSYIAFVLLIGMAITMSIGKPVFNLTKLAGICLAAITVIPGFLYLRKMKRTGDTKAVLKALIGGFLYKLVVLLIGVWLALSKAGLDTTNFVVSCLVFVFAFQVCESLFFWAKSDN